MGRESSRKSRNSVAISSVARDGKLGGENGAEARERFNGKGQAALLFRGFPPERTPSYTRRVRRLFSTFAYGVPDAGLLLLRLAPGGALLFHAIAGLSIGPTPALVAFHVLCATMGLLLVVGLWTPIVGALAAIEAALLGFPHLRTSGPHPARYAGRCPRAARARRLVGRCAIVGWRRIEIPAGRADAHGNRDEPPPCEGSRGPFQVGAASPWSLQRAVVPAGATVSDSEGNYNCLMPTDFERVAFRRRVVARRAR